MILVNAFLAIFFIFATPQILLYYKYNNLKYSLILIIGVVISLSMSWVIFLISFIFGIDNIYLYILSLLSFLYTLLIVYKNTHYERNNNIFRIWILSLTIMIPSLIYFGYGYNAWDAIVSWNRWAIELYDNIYQSINAAYPILLPAIWSLIYKIQGTSEIWFTSQLTLFFLPLILVVFLLTLFKETHEKTYLFILVLIYPYLVWRWTYIGYMDMPVMLIGLLSIISMYTAEVYKNKGNNEFICYIYLVLLLSGTASLVKQAGLMFLIFNLVYLKTIYFYSKGKK